MHFFLCNRPFTCLEQDFQVFPLHHISISSSSTPRTSHETFDGIDLGIAFQYPSNWVKFEGGFDPNVLKDFEGVVSFDIFDDPLNQANGASSEDSGLVHPNLSIVSLEITLPQSFFRAICGIQNL